MEALYDDNFLFEKMKRIIFNKKAQVGQLAPAILALVFAGIVLVLGLVMLQSIRDTNLAKETETGTTSQDSVIVNETGTTLTTCYATSEGSISSITSVTNTTLYNENIVSGNYSTSGCVITYVESTGDYNNTGWEINYTYTYTGGLAYTGANATVTGLGTFGDFWEIIVLAIVISLIIGLLLVVFGGTKRR